VPVDEAEKKVMLEKIENILKTLSPEYFENNQVNEFI